LFPTAINEYLKGNWVAAEEVLLQVLRHDRRHVAARLMRATLLRRTGRLDEAEAELAKLSTFEAADGWKWEIDRELRYVERRRKRLADAGESDSQDHDRHEKNNKDEKNEKNEKDGTNADREEATPTGAAPTGGEPSDGQQTGVQQTGDLGRQENDFDSGDSTKMSSAA
jgi:hypothetical protein